MKRAVKENLEPIGHWRFLHVKILGQGSPDGILPSCHPQAHAQLLFPSPPLFPVPLPSSGFYCLPPPQGVKQCSTVQPAELRAWGRCMMELWGAQVHGAAVQQWDAGGRDLQACNAELKEKAGVQYSRGGGVVCAACHPGCNACGSSWCRPRVCSPC